MDRDVLTPDGRWIAVRWSEEDGEFVATCDAYPTLSWLDEDAQVAAECLRNLIDELEANVRALCVADEFERLWPEHRVRMRAFVGRSGSVGAASRSVSGSQQAGEEDYDGGDADGGDVGRRPVNRG